jgi:lysophospholipase
MQFYDTPDNPLPRGAETYAAHTRRNLRLRAITAPPHSGTGLAGTSLAGTSLAGASLAGTSLAGTSRGTVVFLNGRADFVERYFETMADMQRRGFHVAGFDWRGQGGSQRLLRDPLRGHIRSYREYDEDLRTVMEGVVTKNCPGPYFAIGHSTGGHILLRALSRKTWFSKAIVTSPLMALRFGRWPKGVAFFLAAIATALGFGWAYLPGFSKKPFLLRGFEDNILTSDRQRWARDLRIIQEHPNLGIGGPTYAWLVATILSLRDLHRRRKGRGLNCPVLMILAGREQVVDNKAAHDYALNMPGVSVVTIAPALHEIMLENDAIRREFLAAFDSYIGSTL